MRGEITEYNSDADLGVVTGDDGGRYNFDRSDLRRPFAIRPGRLVDFQIRGEWARDILAADVLATSSAPKPPRATSAVRDDTLWGRFIDAWLRRTTDFEGRSTRRDYWGFMLFSTLIWMATCLVMFPLVLILQGAFVIAIPFVLVLWGWFAIANLSLTIRRLHDVGVSGWVLLMGIVVQTSPLFLFIGVAEGVAIGFVDSEIGSNDYGQDPKGRGNDLTVA